MKQTPFHHYYAARTLEAIACEDRFVPAYASSSSKVYPFQVAAANFVLRSPYQKGAVLCDEAGLGKSHEAMLTITQKWLEGQRRILLAVPNDALLCQWAALMDDFYSVPYVVLSTHAQWDVLTTEEEPNPFLQPLLSPPTNLLPPTRNRQRPFPGTWRSLRRPTPFPPFIRRAINRQKPSSA